MTASSRPPRLRLEPATRLPRMEPAAVIGVLVLGALIIGWELYTARAPAPPEGPPRSLCLVRTATGVPCPGCGGTRAIKSAVTLKPLEALAHNPLLVLGGVVFAGVLLLRVTTGRAVRLDFTQQGWVVVAVVFGVLVLMNWIWVLHQHGTISF